MEDRCTVCAEHTIGSKIIFGRTQWYSYLTRLKWKFVSSHLEIVLILTQDRCTVCSEQTISLEIILEAPDGNPRWRGSCGISFWSVWRQCNCRCKIGERFAPNILRNHFGVSRWYSSVTRLKWKLVSVQLEIVLVFTHGLRQTYHRLRNHFGSAWWNSLVMWVMWNLVLAFLEAVLVSVQDRCTICAKHTIGSKNHFGSNWWYS